MIRLVVAIALLVPSLALASPEPHRFAVAINPRIGWGSAWSGSAYVAITDHQVLRANYARYKLADAPPPVLAISVLVGSYENETYTEGGYQDIGASWVYFLRRPFSGPSFELGALRRDEDTYIQSENRYPYSTSRTSVYYAGRWMVGWSWDFKDRAFIAIASGMSAGYAKGVGANQYDRGLQVTDPMPYRVAQIESAFECYMRLGFSFGAL